MLLLLPLWRQNQSIRLYFLLMLSGCCYLLGEIFSPVEPNSLLRWFEFIGGNALPGLFWLVSLSVFGDHVVLKRGQYLLASMTLVIPLSSTLLQLIFDFQLSQFPFAQTMVKYGAMLLELLLISHALIIAAQQWRNDLVQERRYIRGSVICISGLYIFLVIFLGQLLDIQWLGFDLLKAFLLAILIMGINFFLFRLRESSLFETISSKGHNAAGINKQPSKELSRVINAMVEEKLYQQDGLTIASFAKHLSIHEYKLRQLINGEMNYRNFNDFLNFYRIKEVSEKLTQTDYIQTPVLTLALESGFRSLSSFNKVFKETHAITPTQYRKKYQS
ncbi:MAG: helix-turn-helix domain-containing protein [Colwellia sp.]|nr:helix-turn-helix domain-containing protein [Colwellia sp.]MCW9083105.1 helix-turn-helix domain-containing protein [Colwellia sp.]